MSGVIRTDAEKELLIAMIRAMDWAFKYYIQDLFPKATPDQFRYLFGIIYQRVMDFQGETNIPAVHENMMRLFNVKFVPREDGTFELERQEGKKFTTISIAQYIELIRAYFVTEHGVSIEEDYEIFVNE